MCIYIFFIIYIINVKIINLAIIYTLLLEEGKFHHPNASYKSSKATLDFLHLQRLQVGVQEHGNLSAQHHTTQLSTTTESEPSTKKKKKNFHMHQHRLGQTHCSQTLYEGTAPFFKSTVTKSRDRKLFCTSPWLVHFLFVLAAILLVSFKLKNNVSHPEKW